MSDQDRERLVNDLRETWRFRPHDPKVERYIGKFFDRQRIDQKIVARVQGNHGVYTVVIQVMNGHPQASCTCYIGRYGNCHHCDALARTFLAEPESFREIVPKTFDEVNSLTDLPDYLNYVTLAELMERLKAAGIRQKAFAEAIGLSANTITTLKASEARHARRYELGAVKLAALWVLETFGE